MKNIYKDLHGFTVTSSKEIKEISGNVVNMLHTKSGARLVFIDRDDTNKSFAIGFSTPPTDDSGVFHIIEHTVLAGSEKYPVKDVMTAVMTGTHFSYMNALTFPDKTVFPVSSKNDKAFLDLVSVYMDAVFHPIVLRDKNIFMSEGQHLTLVEGQDPEINGVVYNEMKGAFASADELMGYYLSQRLYSGGSYSFESGGHPDSILNLTYEDFLEVYYKHYTPKNAVIALDGSVDLDKTLALLDSFLSAPHISSGEWLMPTLGKPNTDVLYAYYQIAEGTDKTNKNHLALSYPTFSVEENEKHSALSITLSTLTDGNTAPLKKKVLSTGLCENVYVSYNRDNLKGALTIHFVNVKDGCEEELIIRFKEIIQEILNTGISTHALLEALNFVEFNKREGDEPFAPRGIINVINAIHFTLLGMNSYSGLEYEELFSNLRAKLGTDYFLNVLAEVFNTPNVTVILKPDPELAERKAEEDKQKLNERITALTPAEREKISLELEAYDEWLNTPECEEALATLPILTRRDLKLPHYRTPINVEQINGVEVISHNMDISGITYVNMLFDVTDIKPEYLPALSIYMQIVRELDTENFTAREFLGKIKYSLGELNMYPTQLHKNGEARVMLELRASALNRNRDEMYRLIDEFLYKRRLDDKESIKRKLKQLYTDSLEALNAEGAGAALIRSYSNLTPAGKMRDAIMGLGTHELLKAACAAPDEYVKRLAEIYTEVKEKYLTRSRLTVSVTANDTEGIAKELIKLTRPGTKDKIGGFEFSEVGEREEAILSESTVGHAALSTTLKKAGIKKYTGALNVLSSIITNELLWPKIRISRGAYGTDFFVGTHTGIVSASTYCDPTPEESVEYFRSLKDDLLEILSSVDVEKYVISTAAATDAYVTPRMEATASTALYLNGYGDEYLENKRREILATDRDTLTDLGTKIADAFKDGVSCISAPKNLLRKDLNRKINEL